MTPPQFRIIAGINGAGKTTLASAANAFLGDAPPTINPDRVAAAIAGSCPDIPYDLANLYAARMCEEEVDRRIAAREPLGVETVLSSPKYKHRLEAARDAGFRIVLIFVALPDVREALFRVALRVRAGGHDVPEERMRARWARVHDNLAWFAREADVGVALCNAGRKSNATPLALWRRNRPGAIFVEANSPCVEARDAILRGLAPGDHKEIDKR